MKVLFSTLFAIVFNVSYGQYPCDEWYIEYDINFEDTTCIYNLTIDTISNPNNIWQIGSPNKTIFVTAHSNSNVMVTDTISSYPVNDTSSFIIKNLAGGGFSSYGEAVLGGWYQVNSDSLNDFGMIEFSPDNGTTWIDVLNETTIEDEFYWETEVPVLTGNSNGWKYFHVWLGGFSDTFNMQEGDTVQYRFTFISDSISSSHDGLMFDDFHFEDWWWGVEEFEKIKSTAYPNPATKSVKLEFDNANFSTFHCGIIDALGKVVFEDKISQQSVQLAVDKLPDGLYYYYLTAVEKMQRAWGKFVVQKE